ncbi:hypothetical protein ACFSX9_09725 [Flavobacterium ardleyense]|uniref:Uncharacterized protein n=1 Tax=Flavobacterium ardleyense TaxID=2038737 RepID=A0ABW5Z9M0_9FLAO
MRIEQDHAGKWNLNILCNVEISANNNIPKSNNQILSNAFIETLHVELYDENGISILVENEKGQSIKSNFNSGSVNIDIPITGEHKNVNGIVNFTVNEYSNLSYKEFKKNSKNVSFDLGNVQGIKLLSIEKNKAYLLLPSKNSEIEINATNKSNENFAEVAKLTIPKTIYDFSKRKDLTDESIQNFVNELSYADAYKNSQILILETNGIIENLYIYLKSEPKVLSTEIIKLQL